MKVLTKVVKKYWNKLSYEERTDIINEYWNDYTDLPNTCTAADLGTCRSEVELAMFLNQLRLGGIRYVISNVTDAGVIPLYEKFGFVKVHSYMGGHRKKVHSMQVDISNLRPVSTQNLWHGF